MSAFLCGPDHIGQLAAWGCRSGRLAWSDRRDPAEVARVLARENLRSIAWRYPDAPHAADWFGITPAWSDEQYFEECAKAATAVKLTELARMTPAAILKSVACLRYQSCERPDYDRSEAAKLLATIEAAATAELPGYEAAAWGAPLASH